MIHNLQKKKKKKPNNLKKTRLVLYLWRMSVAYVHHVQHQIYLALRIHCNLFLIEHKTWTRRVCEPLRQTVCNVLIIMITVSKCCTFFAHWTNSRIVYNIQFDSISFRKELRLCLDLMHLSSNWYSYWLPRTNCNQMSNQKGLS